MPKFKIEQKVGWVYGGSIEFVILDIKKENDRNLYLIRYLTNDGGLNTAWFYEMELIELEKEQ